MCDSHTVEARTERDQQQSEDRPTLRRRPGACDTCKQRKVRCDGNRPCSQCCRYGSDCQYMTAGRKRRASVATGATGATGPDILSIHAGLQNATTVHINSSPMQSNPYYPPPTTNDCTSMSMSPTNLQIQVNHLSEGSSTLGTLDEQSHLHFPANTNKFTEWEWASSINDDKFYTAGEILQSAGPNCPFVESSLETSPGGNQLMPHGPIFSQNTEYSTDWNLELNTASALMANVPVAKFADKMPKVDFSAAPLLGGLQTNNLRLPKLKQEHLLKMLEELAIGRLETSFNVALRGSRRSEHTLCYERKFVQECVNICYSDQEGIGTFLERRLLDDIAYRALDQSLNAPASVALFNAVLAIGSHHLDLEGDSNILAGPQHDALSFFTEALNLLPQITSGEISIQNLQALLAMAYFAIRIGSKLTSTLIMHATYCVQTLRLNNDGAINKLYQNYSEQQHAKRAFWFLYSIEKPHCLRERMLSVLDEDFINHVPPNLSRSSEEPNWLLINCRYSHICSSILKELHGKKSLQKHSSSLVQHALNAWKNDLPFISYPLTRAINYSALSFADRRLRLGTIFKYHEAVIALYTGWARPETMVLGSPNGNLPKNEEICIESARDILAGSCYINLTDILQNQTLYNLVSIATCVIFVAITRNPSSQKDLSYLAMASGFFGRLSLDAKVPFDEVTELSRIAQRLVKDTLEQNEQI